MNARERKGNQLKGCGWETVWFCESDCRENENVVDESVGDIAAPVTSVLFGNETGGLKNKIGKEMG
jgi:hypothetical protein